VHDGAVAEVTVLICIHLFYIAVIHADHFRTKQKAGFVRVFAFLIMLPVALTQRDVMQNNHVLAVDVQLGSLDVVR